MPTSSPCHDRSARPTGGTDFPRRRSRLAALSAVAALLLAVAGWTAPAGATSQEAPFGAWRAVEVEGSAPASGLNVTLDLSPERAAGHSACNRYTGKAELKGTSVAFGPLAATRMACPPAPMALEARYLSALNAARGWRLERGQLLLTDGAGRVLVRFTRAP